MNNDNIEVYSPGDSQRQIPHFKEPLIMAKLPSGKVITFLGISKQTLLKWILVGKIKADIKTVGGRRYYEFDEKEVKKIRNLMDKHRKRGKPYF